MEIKKSSVIIITIVSTLCIILALSANKSLEKHYEKETLVLNNRIKEAAKKCYLKKECTGNITLKDLYDKDYLSKQVDPKTKEYLNEELCLKYENNIVDWCELLM